MDDMKEKSKIFKSVAKLSSKVKGKMVGNPLTLNQQPYEPRKPTKK